MTQVWMQEPEPGLTAGPWVTHVSAGPRKLTYTLAPLHAPRPARKAVPGVFSTTPSLRNSVPSLRSLGACPVFLAVTWAQWRRPSGRHSLNHDLCHPQRCCSDSTTHTARNPVAGETANQGSGPRRWRLPAPGSQEGCRNRGSAPHTRADHTAHSALGFHTAVTRRQGSTPHVLPRTVLNSEAILLRT